MTTIAPNFGSVAAVVGASFLVHHIFMGLGVSSARKKYQIKYPALYADAENCKNEEHRQTFNCIQRAHQNSLENQPIFLASLITAGLQYPLTASAFGTMYLLGRIIYFFGYSSGKPEGRMQGGLIGYAGLLPLVGMCITKGVNLGLGFLS